MTEWGDTKALWDTLDKHERNYAIQRWNAEYGHVHPNNDAEAHGLHTIVKEIVDKKGTRP